MIVKKIKFKEFADERGNLVSIEQFKNVPFEIKRVYFIYNVDREERRGFHAHKDLQQVLLCISGSCKVLLDNGVEKSEVLLNEKNEGILVENYIWREMFDFSSDAVLMVLASEYYCKEDYIRDYNEFIKYSKSVNENNRDFKFKSLNVFIHPRAIVDTNFVGRDTRVWGFTHILSEAQIGDNCNINEYVFIENKVILGNNVTVKCGVYIWDNITVEDNVFIGPSVTFTNDKHPRSKQYPLEFEKTILKRGCSIGANATILCGLVIGEYATIGAGAVVTKNVAPYEVVVGNPAVFKNYNCKCGEILNQIDDKFICKCGKIYKYDKKECIIKSVD